MSTDRRIQPSFGEGITGFCYIETDTLAILEKESARVLSDFKLTNAK